MSLLTSSISYVWENVGKMDGLMKSLAPQIIYSFHCAIIGIKWRWKDLNFIAKNCEFHVCYGLIMGKAVGPKLRLEFQS